MDMHMSMDMHVRISMDMCIWTCIATKRNICLERQQNESLAYTMTTLVNTKENLAPPHQDHCWQKRVRAIFFLSSVTAVAEFIQITALVNVSRYLLLDLHELVRVEIRQVDNELS